MQYRKKEREREALRERRTRWRGKEECGLQERESVVAKADRSADHPELALRLRWVWARAGWSCLLASLCFALRSPSVSLLFSSPLLFSLLNPSRCWYPPGYYVLSLWSTKSFSAGLFDRFPRSRIEILLCADRLSESLTNYNDMKREELLLMPRNRGNHTKIYCYIWNILGNFIFF